MKFKLVLAYCGAVRMSVLDDIGKEVQEGDLLCWAAVSTMAVRAFPEDAKFKHPTQAELVIYHRAGIKSVTHLVEAEHPPNKRATKFAKAKLTCAAGLCNATNSNGLHLYDLNSTKVAAGKVLTPGHFGIEIETRKCPVTIRWDYGSGTNGSSRSGAHALIITGYKADTHQLRLWDPWPVLLNADPDPGQHEKWIPYETYVDPQNDEGLGAVAQHEFDEYKLRRKGTKIPAGMGYPSLTTLPEPATRQEISVNFEGETLDLLKPIDKFLRAHVVRNSAGDAVHGPYTAGDPFPIVPLRIATLRKASQPESLLKPQTSAVVVPILKDGQIIDSFLLLHDKRGWRPGGYSNNKIAALLTEAREIHARELPARSFYLVSIPELSTFFVASGFADRARLAPLNDHGQKTFARSREVLGAVVARLRGETGHHPKPV